MTLALYCGEQTWLRPSCGTWRMAVSEPLSIGLNAQYLLDFFDEAETESVRLELKDENTQCLCSPEGGIDGASRYLYVVMPMRL